MFFSTALTDKIGLVLRITRTLRTEKNYNLISHIAVMMLWNFEAFFFSEDAWVNNLSRLNDVNLHLTPKKVWSSFYSVTFCSNPRKVSLSWQMLNIGLTWIILRLSFVLRIHAIGRRNFDFEESTITKISECSGWEMTYFVVLSALFFSEI